MCRCFRPCLNIKDFKRANRLRGRWCEPIGTKGRRQNCLFTQPKYSALEVHRETARAGTASPATSDAVPSRPRAPCVNAGIEEYLKLSRQRDRRVRWRTLVSVAASIVGISSALAMYVLAPGWLLTLSGSAVTLALGWLGQPADEPVVRRAVEVPKVQKLTGDIVLRALGSLGIKQINQAIAKGNDALAFTAPISRDGPGWRAEGDLPYGATVEDVMDRRERLASGLRRPLGCVWPEPVPNRHTGRLVL